MEPITIAAFYKFATIEDVEALKSRLAPLCRANAIRGTILLASEGINATVSGTQTAIERLLGELKADSRFADLAPKLSRFDRHPFDRLKVKVKPEILTFGVPEADPCRRVGAYVAPEQWNALISEPDVLLIDTRNDYEYRVGTFEGAVDPATRSFHEFPAYVAANLDPARHKRIAMFCTGGIRCEKATAYMLMKGFREVYHLEGGILAYLETIPAESSLWRGECFVFDDRVAVGHGVEPGRTRLCLTCGQPVLSGKDACSCREGKAA